MSNVFYMERLKNIGTNRAFYKKIIKFIFDNNLSGASTKDIIDELDKFELTKNYKNQNATLTALRNLGFVTQNNFIGYWTKKWLNDEIKFDELVSVLFIARNSHKKNLKDTRNTFFEFLKAMKTKPKNWNALKTSMAGDDDFHDFDIFKNFILNFMTWSFNETDTDLSLSVSGFAFLTWMEKHYMPNWKKEFSKIENPKELPNFLNNSKLWENIPKITYTNKNISAPYKELDHDVVLFDYLFNNNGTTKDLELQHFGRDGHGTPLSNLLNFHKIDYSRNNRGLYAFMSFIPNIAYPHFKNKLINSSKTDALANLNKKTRKVLRGKVIPKIRKLDWEKINAEKARIGKLGEEVVYAFLKEIKEENNVVHELKHVSVLEGDGHGYDITGFISNSDNTDFVKAFIEVKASKNKIYGFSMSKNEYKVANELMDQYVIALVEFAGSEKQKIKFMIWNDDLMENATALDYHIKI